MLEGPPDAQRARVPNGPAAILRWATHRLLRSPCHLTGGTLHTWGVTLTTHAKTEVHLGNFTQGRLSQCLSLLENIIQRIHEHYHTVLETYLQYLYLNCHTTVYTQPHLKPFLYYCCQGALVDRRVRLVDHSGHRHTLG